MPTLSFKQVLTILKKENLLKEWIQDNSWSFSVENAPDYYFSNLSYDSRKVDSHTLFFVKGSNFKEAYLKKAFEDGLKFYVAETRWFEILCS